MRERKGERERERERERTSVRWNEYEREKVRRGEKRKVPLQFYLP